MPEPVTVLGSEMHLIDSTSTGRRYRITVSLPLGYNAAPGEDWPFNAIPAKWPTVYVVDGNQYAGMVTDMIRPAAWCGGMTDAIVVGIGYPESADVIETFREYFLRRDQDLTPIHDPVTEKNMSEGFKRPVPNGDAGNFHKFIRDEVIPLIEQEYRSDPARRILAGHSYGGLFALFGLFTTPDLFHSLIVGSPTLGYSNRWTFGQEEAFAQAHKAIPATVYLYATELEESIDDTTLTETLRMAAILQSRKYEGFTLVKRIFPEQNHCEVAAPGFVWGLRLALKK